jgi:hypothetical protein
VSPFIERGWPKAEGFLKILSLRFAQPAPFLKEHNMEKNPWIKFWGFFLLNY